MTTNTNCKMVLIRIASTVTICMLCWFAVFLNRSIAGQLTDGKQIRITDLKVTPVASGSCKVLISLRADYSGIEIGSEPKLWHKISDDKKVYWFWIPLNDYRASKTRIIVKDREIKLALDANCIGTFEGKFWITDGDIRSNDFEIHITFKE